MNSRCEEGVCRITVPPQMMIHCVAARPVLWLSALLAVAGAGTARAEDIAAAFFQEKGFVVISETAVDTTEGDDVVLFEGCETGKEVPQPGPKPLPPAFATPGPSPDVGSPAPPPLAATLIASVVGTWHTSLILGGARVEGIAMLDANGTFNWFERWHFGLTAQVWGAYTVSPISPTLFQLSQKPTGWEPREWCSHSNVCTELNYPAAASQFTFLDADTLRDEQTKAIYRRQ